jgi:hypothetical protein
MLVIFISQFLLKKRESAKKGCRPRRLHSEESLEKIAIISELLRGLELKGCIVTTSAFGCHKSTAEQVVGQGSDYVLAAKANQPKRHTSLQHLFDPSDYQLNRPAHELQDLLRIASEPM